MRRWLPLLVAIVAAVAFRLPILLNAKAINSDAAIVGVQARHLLDGEFSARLWGSPYQAPLESVFAAGLFLVSGGASALGVLMVPLLGVLLMIALAWLVLEKHAGGWGAALAVLPLVFATYAMNAPMSYVMRQSIATLAIFIVWLMDSEKPRALLLAGVLIGFGSFLDTFFSVLIPPLLLFGGARFWGHRRRVIAFGATIATSFIVTRFLMWLSGASSHVDRGDVGTNWRFLWKQCLPFALGLRTWMPGSVEWEPHVAWVAVTVLALVALVAGIGLGASGVLRTRFLPHLILGVSAALTAIVAFLSSSAPFDMWSSRYLAPLIWFLPFTLLPVIARFEVRRAALFIVPWVVCAGVSGWASYGPFVSGPMIERTREGRGEDADELLAALRSRGVHHAQTNYWQSYRLSLLWREDPLVVPVEPELDRRSPLRAAVLEGSRVALLFEGEEPPMFRDSLIGTTEVDRTSVGGKTLVIRAR
ncbi:MAG: hypothetical protein JNM17_10270 [Archangium sp.]|nr:hypothetical protein [Archangium sp.]